MQPTGPLIRLLVEPGRRERLLPRLPLAVGEPADVVVVDASAPPAPDDLSGVVVGVGALPSPEWIGRLSAFAASEDELSRVLGAALLRAGGLEGPHGLVAWRLVSGARGAALWSGDGLRCEGVEATDELEALAVGAAGGELSVKRVADDEVVVTPLPRGSVLLTLVDPDGLPRVLAASLEAATAPASQVLAKLDHDVRSPAFAIRLSLAILERSGASADVVDRIKRSLEEMLALVKRARHGARAP